MGCWVVCGGRGSHGGAVTVDVDPTVWEVQGSAKQADGRRGQASECAQIMGCDVETAGPGIATQARVRAFPQLGRPSAQPLSQEIARADSPHMAQRGVCARCGEFVR